MEKLIGLIKDHVAKYKKKHGRIYLLFSRIFFGNIDTISKNLTHHLETIQQRQSSKIPQQNQTNFIRLFILLTRRLRLIPKHC
ncbi:MAG: hypothetical protein HWD61_14015 [Parachlamydiaceae bacterium]|nr:MAG: hypothetical protein HWD61_14015 [Parachlamydiaceae bacterium]